MYMQRMYTACYGDGREHMLFMVKRNADASLIHSVLWIAAAWPCDLVMWKRKRPCTNAGGRGMDALERRGPATPALQLTFEALTVFRFQCLSK